MPDNPYTRTVVTTVTELVPDRGQLPYCAARLSRDINGHGPRRPGRSDRPVLDGRGPALSGCRRSTGGHGRTTGRARSPADSRLTI